MIPRRYLIVLFVCLTLFGLLACEPLAPDQTPQYIVVTGETPDTVMIPSQTPPVVQTGQPGASGAGSVSGAGVVNTPLPTDTPPPVPTALPSATPFVCAQTAGQMFVSSFFSAITGEEVTFEIYLPPCFYDTLQRYPYVILLHGTSYDDTMWVDLDAPGAMDRGVSKGSLPPMVLVMPDGGLLSEYNDLPEGASYETVILEELIPAVERDFCLWGSPQGRALGGISRGGFWAFSIALRHPELFSALGGHSPHFEPDNAGPATNPLDLALTASLDKTPLRIYMDHATDDYVGTYASLMSELLRSRNVPHEYIINPTGNHDTAYWSAHVADYLAFYGAQWPLNAAELPSCLEPSP